MDLSESINYHEMSYYIFLCPKLYFELSDGLSYQVFTVNWSTGSARLT